MKCLLCKTGKTYKGHATVTLNRDETVVVIKQVPAEICENCGEYYLSEQMTQFVLERAEDAVEKGAEVEIFRFAA
ncbi:Type II toxin-antitoxin system MqsA family antitoxin [Candidatus Magnetomoraceae bacterium gMMP-15]